MYFLFRRGFYFCQDERSREAELWSRAINLKMVVSESEMTHAEYGYCVGFQSDLEFQLGIIAKGIMHTMVSNCSDYEPNFSRCVSHGVKELEVLSQLSYKADFEVVDTYLVLNLVMDIFCFG